VSKVNRVYSAFERIHHWQRTTKDLSADESVKFIIGYADDLFKKRIDSVYNELVGYIKSSLVADQVPPEFSLPIKDQ
jgi:hypothetical protein